MPYIHVQTKMPTSEQQRQALRRELEQAVEQIPGKTREWMLMAFSTPTELCWGGDAAQNCAFVEMRIWGDAKNEEYDAVAKSICGALQKQLDIPPEKVYIHFVPGKTWGWNGSLL